VVPGRDSTYGSNHYTDVAVDATYQYMANPRHIFETKTSYLYEDQKLSANQLAGTINSMGNTYLTSFKINTAYTFDQTYGVTFAYNRTTGSTDALLYSSDMGYSLNKPNSQYYTAELVYVAYQLAVYRLCSSQRHQCQRPIQQHLHGERLAGVLGR
jgi:hypothetical protein